MTIHCSTDAFSNFTPTARVYLSHGHFEGRRGQTYNVHLGAPDGEKIVANAFDPEYAACRALVARGVAGRLEVWRPGSTFPAMVIRDIAKGARLTIREDARRGPCVVKYRPRFEPDGIVEEDAELPSEMARA
jgi:hypothetical protein